MIFTKSNTAKVAAGFVGFALAFAFVVAPAPAKAETLADLQAMIAALQAQIAALSGGSSSSSSHTFTTDLTVGSTGAEVVALQQFLVSKGFLSMPAGVAMGTFGSMTQSALAAYQSSKGITPAAGYFGPATRASVNSMMVVPPTTGNNNSNNSGSTLNGGAGDVTVTSRSAGTDSEVMEGDEEVAVLGFEVEADGSDVKVTSVRVEFEHSGSGSTRLSRYVDEVQVMMGGKVVGSADVSDFKKDGDVYSRNIPVSAVVKEDAKARFHVAVTATSNIDTNDLGEDWDVTLGQIRFEDATGAILTDDAGNGDITETFSFEDLASSGDIELKVNEDDESINDAHTVQVDDSSDTNDVEILSFTLEADGSDISLDEMIFDITSTGAGVTEIANDFRLMMDGEEVGRLSLDTNQDNTGGDSFASSTDTAVAVIFTDLEDDDVVISEGDEVSFTLVADINDIDGAFTAGDKLSVSLDANTTDIDAEDENGDVVEDLTGSADSANISFAANGIMLSTGDSEPTATVSDNGTTSVTTDDYGTFVINFDVTAFEDTAYIALTAASSTSATPSDAGAFFYMESTSADGTALGTGTTTSALERVSGGTLSGNYVKINAGQTAKLKLTVYFDPSSTDVFRAQLYAVNFAETAAAGTSQQLALPTEDYQSQSVRVSN